MYWYKIWWKSIEGIGSPYTLDSLMLFFKPTIIQYYNCWFVVFDCGFDGLCFIVIIVGSVLIFMHNDNVRISVSIVIVYTSIHELQNFQ